MAPPSKTIMDLECESRNRDRDPIGYAIIEHERTKHGLFSFFSGVSPSKTIPPAVK